MLVPKRSALESVRQAMRRRNVLLKRHHLWTKVERGTRNVFVQLGHRHNPIPSPDRMQREIETGRVEEGSLEGAEYWLEFEMWHYVGDRHDAKAALVEVETSRILRQAMAPGPEGKQGLRKAVAEALGQLDVPFSPATNGRVAGHDAPSDVYRVERGDSLWSIAEEAYGRGGEWQKIYRANQKTIGPDPQRIEPGQVLTLP